MTKTMEKKKKKEKYMLTLGPQIFIKETEEYLLEYLQQEQLRANIILDSKPLDQKQNKILRIILTMLIFIIIRGKQLKEVDPKQCSRDRGRIRRHKHIGPLMLMPTYLESVINTYTRTLKHCKSQRP